MASVEITLYRRNSTEEFGKFTVKKHADEKKYIIEDERSSLSFRTLASIVKYLDGEINSIMYDHFCHHLEKIEISTDINLQAHDHVIMMDRYELDAVDAGINKYFELLDDFVDYTRKPQVKES